MEEGWPTVLIESLACGKPIIPTDVSGARDIISEGKNGFLIRERDPHLFAEAMERALELDSGYVKEFSLNEVEKYSLDKLAKNICNFWSPLHG